MQGIAVQLACQWSAEQMMPPNEAEQLFFSKLSYDTRIDRCP